MDYDNKLVKNYKTTTQWITCLNNTRISRVLQLIEMFPEGLLQRDIFSLLDAPRDKGIMQALKELEYHGFIKKEIKFGKPVKAINQEIKVKGKRLIKDIQFGIETKRVRYMSAGNPIKKLFEKINELAKNEPQRKYLELLMHDISTRWRLAMLNYSFASTYPNTEWEQNTKQIIESLDKAVELYKGEQLEKAQKDKDKIVTDLKQLRQDMSEHKKTEQLFQINALRLKGETHIEYVSLQLQRILLEFFIILHINYYKIDKSEVDAELINTIETLLYEINPELKKVPMIDEVASRIKNFNNLIEIRKSSDKLRKTFRRNSKG